MDILDEANLGGHGYERAGGLLEREEESEDLPAPSSLRRSRRKHMQEPVLNITSFVDVLAVLMFFLLTVTTLEKLGAHDVNLPRQSEAFAAESKAEVKNLSVSLARDEIRLRGLVTPKEGEPEPLGVRLPVVEEAFDAERLTEELLRLKTTYETDDALILMVSDDVPFEWIVRVMDASREIVEYEEGRRVVTKLFPEVSLSDYLVETAPKEAS